MLYDTIADLPESLTSVLPEEAQEVYLEAYKTSWEAYEEHQGGELDREAVAHRDGWTAVRREYVKDESTGRWYPEGELPEEEEEEEEGLLEEITDVFQTDESER